MEKEIPIKRNFYGDAPLFDKDEITLKSGFTTLIGCNGCGKTTLLTQIKRYLYGRDIRYVSFNNLTEGGNEAIQEANDRGTIDDLKFFAEAVQSSEGENITLNIAKLMGDVGKAVGTCERKNEKELWVIMDAIDSGLSIDNIVYIKNFLFKRLIPDCDEVGIDLYIVASANEYELARDTMMYDTASCKYIDTILSYDDYYDFIMASMEKKGIREASAISIERGKRDDEHRKNDRSSKLTRKNSKARR